MRSTTSSASGTDVRVGRIPYLNSEPFYFTLDGHELVPLPPRPLGQAMEAGRVDAGPLSLVDFFRLEQTLRSEEHTSELQSRLHLVCRLLLEKKKNKDVRD